jgi:hypothetical protein
MLYNIDSQKAGRSYKCCAGHPQGRALRAVQKRLLAATDRYIASRRFWAAYGDDTPDLMSLRHQSAIWALVAVKRDLQRAI